MKSHGVALRDSGCSIVSTSGGNTRHPAAESGTVSNKKTLLE